MVIILSILEKIVQTEKNIEANLTSDNFKLSAEDIKAIDEMPADGFSGLNPSLIEF